MREGVLWDSGAVLALLDERDENHARAVEIAGQLADEKRPGFMTNYVVVETHALLLTRLGRAPARAWLFGATVPMSRAQPSEEERAKEIIARYEDKDWSLCDAISFAVMEMRGVRAAFSFDHHFRQYGGFQVLGA